MFDVVTCTLMAPTPDRPPARPMRFRRTAGDVCQHATNRPRYVSAMRDNAMDAVGSWLQGLSGVGVVGTGREAVAWWFGRFCARLVKYRHAI